MNKWDTRHMEMAALVATWSKDPSTKVGCVICMDKRVVSTGFNGYPSGISDIPGDTREIKLYKTVHAEVNAILHAKSDLSGCSLYVTPIPPCAHCAAIISQTGIWKVVVGLKRDLDVERWKESTDIAKSMFREKEIAYMEVYLD